MPQTLNKNISASKVDGLLRTVRAVQADAEGNLPTRIMILRCGNWPDSVKGNLTIVQADLEEFKRNFDMGVGLVSKEVGLPIDFSHNEWAQAAGWIKDLAIEGDALYASVEWSTEGAAAINGGMFKCISPSFYPAARGGWEDPEDLTNIVGNVLVGAGLTNIPFFKDLTPVKASQSTAEDSDDDKNVVYISATNKGEKRMTLDEVRLVAADKLTEEQKTFLIDNKAQLSGDELKKFGLEEKVAAAATTGDALSDEDAQLLADVKSGKIKTVKEGETVVDASRLTALEETAKQYRTEKAETIVDAHIARGAIKADTKDRWVTRLLNASGDDRTALEDDLTALPSNKQIGEEVGEDGDDASGTAREQIAKLATARVTKAKEEGKELDYVTAQREVLAANPDLAAQDRAENKF